MNRRLLILGIFVLLLASVAAAFYVTAYNPRPVLPPPAEAPILPVERKEPVNQEVPAVAESEKEEGEAVHKHTVRVRLQKKQLVEKQAPSDTSFSLKKAKAREIVPGVTVENKELSIQLEQVNESLNIRRANNEQVQMLWKQKF